MSANPTTPTPEDLIALSSYLDDELSAPEREALEQRLSTDEDLRTELESLRETVELVQSLPYLKAPRNFTLDPTIYGADSQPNNVTYLSRKTMWRIGAVASIAATFTLVFAILVLGGADNETGPTVNESNPVVGMANDNGASDENFDQTMVAQTAVMVQATQVALSTTSESVQDAQDGTSRTFAVTEVALLGEDESTKATASMLSTTTPLPQSPIPTEDREVSSSAAGVDESASNTLPPVATRTLIASFDATQTANGYLAPTSTRGAISATNQPNAGGGIPPEGQPDDAASDAEGESETAASLPPAETFLSTPTSSPLPTLLPSSTVTPSTTASPSAQSVDDAVPNVPSTDQDAERPETATDTLGDSADTSTTMDSSNNDEPDVFSGDEDADTSFGEEDRDADAVSPPMPNLSPLQEFLDEQLLALIRRIFR